jgi:hypothetical protein
MEKPNHKTSDNAKIFVTITKSQTNFSIANKVTSQNSKIELYNHKKTETLFSQEKHRELDFDNWCDHVNKISIDFSNKFDASTEALALEESGNFESWGKTISEFMDAIRCYKDLENEISHIHSISAISAKHFLLLIPLLDAHNPRIYIDSNNGCFNVDMTTPDNGILSTQVGENGHIHYSYVSQNRKIFKITGTAKFKDQKDYIKFEKVLRMLWK